MFLPTRRGVLAAMTSSLLPCIAVGANPDLSGTWSIDAANSSSDRYPLPEAMTMVVTQDNQKISLDQTIHCD